MIPLYGFLQGDTIGLLVFAYENETVQELAAKLEKSASIRVAPKKNPVLFYHDEILDPEKTVSEIGFQVLEKFEVREGTPG